MKKAPRSFTLWDIAQVIRHNLILITLLSVLGGLSAYIMANRMSANYSATAQLISDAGRSGLITVEEQLPDQFGDASATATMVETVPTPVVLNHAITTMPPDILKLLGQAAKLDEAPPEQADNRNVRHQVLLRHMSQNLEVTNSGRSFVVNLRFNAKDPALAAGAANAIAEGYLNYRIELRNAVYGKMLENLEQQITDLTNNLESAEQTAQTMRERVRLLSQRSDVWAEGQQDLAIAENASLYASQREAEREVDATAVVYEQLLLEHRQIESRMGEPEITVQLFSPAIVPTIPSGFNIKPVLMMLGIVTGFLIGLSIALLHNRRARRKPAMIITTPAGNQS
ncbi:MAG: hypothetical protein ACK5II_13260 [Paracoccus sp. (in: a-proteobacteria)]